MNHNNRPEFDAKDLLAMLRDKTPDSNTREVTVMIRYVNEVLALASSKVRQTVDIWRARNTTRNKIAGEQRWII